MGEAGWIVQKLLVRSYGSQGDCVVFGFPSGTKKPPLGGFIIASKT